MARFSAGTILVGITAVLFGLLGAYIVRKELGRPAEEKKVAEEKKEKDTVVPIAAFDIPAGRQLTLGDIALLKLTPEQLKKSSYAKKPFMNNTKQIIGRILQEPLKKGQTFEAQIFYPEGTGPSVADKLQPGFRAVTITVEADAAVAGFATPGTMVDVLFRSDADAAEDVPEMTVPLIEAVEVLALNMDTAAGKRIEAAPASRRKQEECSVTLAVRPEHAAALQIAEGHGKLSLALRNGAGDLAESAPTIRTLEELLNRPMSKHRIEVYRGRSMSQVEFKRADRLTPTREPAVVSARPSGPAVNAPATSEPTDVPATQDNP